MPMLYGILPSEWLVDWQWGCRGWVPDRGRQMAQVVRDVQIGGWSQFGPELPDTPAEPAVRCLLDRFGSLQAASNHTFAVTV